MFCYPLFLRAAKSRASHGLRGIYPSAWLPIKSEETAVLSWLRRLCFFALLGFDLVAELGVGLRAITLRRVFTVR